MHISGCNPKCIKLGNKLDFLQRSLPLELCYKDAILYVMTQEQIPFHLMELSSNLHDWVSDIHIKIHVYHGFIFWCLHYSFNFNTHCKDILRHQAGPVFFWIQALLEILRKNDYFFGQSRLSNAYNLPAISLQSEGDTLCVMEAFQSYCLPTIPLSCVTYLKCFCW